MTVISLNAAPRARFASIQQMRGYWQALRRDGSPPHRNQIDPRGIDTALAQAFILERVGCGIARFRIAGMHLADLMGMDVRGMPVSAMIDPAGRGRLALALEQVFMAPAVVDIRLIAEQGLARPPLTGRMLILPLRAEGSMLALGCLETEGDIGPKTRRFQIASITQETLTTPTPQPQLQMELAEAPAPYMQKPTHVGRPCLRLVKRER